MSLLLRLWRWLLAKLTLTQVASAYESTQAINANYALIEAAVENTMSLNGAAPNKMAANLDMNGYAILNASILNVDNDSGISIADGVGWAKEWAQNIEDAPVSIPAGGDGITDFSALHWAAKAAASVLLTDANVVATNADLVLTNADVVTTGNNVTAAQGVKTNLQATWYLARAVETNLDDNGAASTAGDVYFNTALNKNRVFDGASWGDTGNGSTSANTILLSDTQDYYAGGNVETAMQNIGAAEQFLVHPFNPGTNYQVEINGGIIQRGTSTVEVSAQLTGVFVNPTSNDRIDRLTLNPFTGSIDQVSGVENASPVPPAIPAGDIALAQVRLSPGGTVMTASMITDERSFIRDVVPQTLDVPIILSSTAVSSTAVGLTHSLLTSNSATVAVLSVVAEVYIPPATLGDATIRANFAKNASDITTSLNTMKAMVTVNHPSSTTGGVYGKDCSTFEVNLDSNRKFWFTGADGGAYVGTSTLTIILVGYR